MEVRKRNRQTCGWTNCHALILGLGIYSGLWQCAYAGELGFGVGYIGGYTDNIQRAPLGPQEDWINTILAGIAYRENGTELAARTQAQVEYRDYTRDVYQDETLFYLDSAAVWTIKPQRLLWTLEDRYDQVPQDATRALTPSNREAINVINTGPDLLVYLNPVDVLVFGARVGNTWLKQSNADNNRYAGIIRWRHQENTSTNISLNFETQKIRFTDAAPPPAPTAQQDYLRKDLYLRLDRRQVLSRLVVDLGGTRIDPEIEESYSKSLIRLNWAQRLSSESAFGLAFNREYMDVGGSLLSTVSDPTAPESVAVAPAIPPAVASGDIFYSQRSDIFYNRTGHYLEVHAGVYKRDINYETIPQDRVETGGAALVTYNITATFAASLLGEAQRTEYQNLNRIDRDMNYGILFSYRISEGLSLNLEGRHYERDSSDALSSYVENRGLLSLLYSSRPIFVPMIRR